MADLNDCAWGVLWRDALLPGAIQGAIYGTMAGADPRAAFNGGPVGGAIIGFIFGAIGALIVGSVLYVTIIRPYLGAVHGNDDDRFRPWSEVEADEPKRWARTTPFERMVIHLLMVITVLAAGFFVNTRWPGAAVLQF